MSSGRCWSMWEGMRDWVGGVATGASNRCYAAYAPIKAWADEAAKSTPVKAVVSFGVAYGIAGGVRSAGEGLILWLVPGGGWVASTMYGFNYALTTITFVATVLVGSSRISLTVNHVARVENDLNDAKNGITATDRANTSKFEALAKRATDLEDGFQGVEYVAARFLEIAPHLIPLIKDEKTRRHCEEIMKPPKVEGGALVRLFGPSDSKGAAKSGMFKYPSDSPPAVPRVVVASTAAANAEPSPSASTIRIVVDDADATGPSTPPKNAAAGKRVGASTYLALSQNEAEGDAFLAGSVVADGGDSLIDLENGNSRSKLLRPPA